MIWWGSTFKFLALYSWRRNGEIVTQSSKHFISRLFFGFQPHSSFPLSLKNHKVSGQANCWPLECQSDEYKLGNIYSHSCFMYSWWHVIPKAFVRLVYEKIYFMKNFRDYNILMKLFRCVNLEPQELIKIFLQIKFSLDIFIYHFIGLQSAGTSLANINTLILTSNPMRWVLLLSTPCRWEAYPRP